MPGPYLDGIRPVNHVVPDGRPRPGYTGNMVIPPTHLDRLMTERGLQNHDLAGKANTSRQSIHKLRRGLTRMSPVWAKRLAPYLGVAWQELIEGPVDAADAARAELLGAYDAMSEIGRASLMDVARGLLAIHKKPERTGDACVIEHPAVRAKG